MTIIKYSINKEKQKNAENKGNGFFAYHNSPRNYYRQSMSRLTTRVQTLVYRSNIRFNLQD